MPSFYPVRAGPLHADDGRGNVDLKRPSDFVDVTLNGEVQAQTERAGRYDRCEPDPQTLANLVIAGRRRTSRVGFTRSCQICVFPQGRVGQRGTIKRCD